MAFENELGREETRLANYKYTNQAKKAIRLADQCAEELNHGYIGSEHLLMGLIREGSGTAAAVLKDIGVKENALLQLIEKLIAPRNAATVLKPGFTPRANRILAMAEEESATMHSEKVGTEHILLAILKEPESVAARLLFSLRIDMAGLYTALMQAAGKEGDPSVLSSAPMETNQLDLYSRDLTALVREGKLDPVIGRVEETDRMIQILSRRTKNNPCLIGEPGVGKTAIAEGLAQRIVSGAVPESVKGKRLVMLDLTGMIAGSKYRGEFEQRIRDVIREVTESGNILLFIDEIHTIIGAGGAEGALDASNILKPALSRGEIQLIGATTREEYRKYIEKDAALERRFQPIAVEEPSQEQAFDILSGLRSYYEAHHSVQITDEALHAAVYLSSRYIHDRFLPDKAIDLIDETSARIRMEGFEQRNSVLELIAKGKFLDTALEEAVREGDFSTATELRKQIEENEKSKKEMSGKRPRSQRRKQVTEEDISKTVSGWTGIPLAKIAEGESKKLLRLEKTLEKRVVGQNEAISAVSKAIRRGRTGLKDPKRPIGSFLFLGPTGVGKTELSKALADAVFGSEDSMIRVDMSEYMEKHSVSKLIGSPPGYVGYEEGGQLSEKIRRNPYTVVLFDEIEKAHPDVFNILLQIMDDGHVTDAQGRKVSFKDCILIMTSNTGASDIIKPKRLGFLSEENADQDYLKMKDRVMAAVQEAFKPEFLNRIDDVIVFRSLTKENMKQIVDILLNQLIRRCAGDKLQIELSVTAKVKEHLIEKSFDQKYGARPLRRAIQNQIEDPLADQILLGAAKKGDHVTVRLQGDEIRFDCKKKAKK